MNLIIECTNFKASKALNTFIDEKTQALSKLNAKISQLVFTLSVAKVNGAKSFSCGLVVHVPGDDIVVKRNSDDAHEVVLKAIDSAKRGLRKQKTRRIASRRDTSE